MATNRNLQKMRALGELREDLYYRLMVFQFELAPLRANKIDLNKKIVKFLEFYKNIHHKPYLCLTQELKDFLENYNWLGNVRELKNCMEYLVVMSNSFEVTLAHLPFWINQKTIEISSEEELVGDYSLDMERFEAKYLKKMLETNAGKINQTARNIKLSKVTLINKAKKYQINTQKMRLTAYEAENVLAA
jgi:transcriptional regulator with PAS, ATPase and Fis domain